MRKEIIAKYIKEFTAWINGESVLVGAPSSMQDASSGKLTWRNVESFKDWKSLDAKYIIDDEYSIFRKSLAEEKTIQCLNIKNNWIDLKNPLFNADVKDYRIKPEEPKFKVGDWVRLIHENTVHQIKYIGSGSSSASVVLTNRNESSVYSKDLIEYKPQPDEWCWFWCSEYNKPIKQLAKFVRMDYSEPEWPFGVTLQNGDSAKFSYCEPFIGDLPQGAKE